MKKVTRFVQVLILFTAMLFSTGAWAQTTLLSESFDGGVLPTGWSHSIVVGTTSWTYNAVGGYLSVPATTHSGAYNARFNYSGYNQKALLITPSINFGTAPVGFLKFWHAQGNWGGDQDSLTVLYRTGPADAWKKLAIYTTNITAWTQESVSLPSVNGTYQIAFRGNAEYGYGVCLDDVLVTALTPPGPSTITLGTGTTSVGTYPYNTFWMDNRTEILYTAAEMLTAGATAGNITNFGLNVATPYSYLMNGFKIEMKATTATSLTDFVEGGFTTVYNTPLNISAAGWQNFTLSTPFAWDGTSNIIVHICFDNTAYGSSNYVYTSVVAGSVVSRYQDNGTGCVMTGATTYSNRPNARLTVIPETGLVQGVVKSSYSGLPINLAVVTSAGSTPPGPYTTAADGAYIFFLPIGTRSVTATATGYLPQTLTVNVGLNGTYTLNFNLDPIPGYLTGIVTNASNGAPLVGVKITYGTKVAYTTAGGVYSIPVYPATAPNVLLTAFKPGFGTYNSVTAGVPVPAVVPPATVTYNIALQEGLNAPGAFTATLNAAQTSVNLSWGLPVGQYLLIYDDGIPENFAVWATAGNKNATKFTPVGYPALLQGGSINIGKISNYPAGANPFGAFQVAVYAADGPGGTPGTELVAPFDVTPTAYGFVDFNITPALNITSGNFYIAMIQGANAPNAAGVAVDTTTQQLRSYSQFGTGPWIPASGNFMIRALMQGAGGPLMSDGMNVTASAVPGLIYATKPATVSGTEGFGRIEILSGDSPDVITGYQVWRLKQGEELTPGVWTTIGTPTATNMVDPAWPSLACGPYRWAVKAQYTGNLWSPATFSNVLGKCWTATVTFNLDLSCDSVTPANTKIVLQNTAYPDTVYTKYSDASGVVIFNNVWKGNYNYTITKFNYITQTAALVVLGDVVVNVTLLQVKTPPTALTVNDRSLFAEWVAPVSSTPLFTENWASGSFATNQWVRAGGANWIMSTSIGNPAPSAEFYYSPVVSNYSQTLTSKNITGVNSPVMKLNYDIFLNNYGNTTLEQMAVELWDGATWHTLKNYDNSSGADIAWTSESLDISAYTGLTFKIRFRAYGEDSNNIDNWNIDNISVDARGPEGVDPCLIAYNFYLNNVLVAQLPPDPTSYQIPPSVVHYGTFYHACVLAVYGSGYSTQACYDFTSRFLYPPTNIQGIGVENSAYITWDKPVVSDNDSPIHVPAFSGVVDHTPPSAGRAPASAITSKTAGNDSPLGSIAFGFDGIALNLEDFDVDNIAGFTVIAPNPASDFMNGFAMPVGETAYTYAVVYGVNNLYKVDRATGALTTVGSIGHSFNDITVDPTTDILYGTDGTSLYSIDPSVPSSTLIGAHGASANLMIGIAADGAGDLWAYDIGNDLFFSLDKTTGVATTVGPIGFNANYAQSMFYDPATSTITMAAYNLTTSGTEIRAVDVTTGASVVLSSASGKEMTASVLPITSGGGGGTPDGLMGYNVYRDGAFRHFVNSPDTLYYYDLNLEPGTYCYDVSAKYDLTDYGFPGQFDESLVASNGPACVEVIYGRPLPFYEPWNSGNFTFNVWATGGANWTVNSGLGNPAPAADFSWQPILADYSQYIETPVLNSAAFSCASIWLDFDLKLADRNSTGDEKLFVEVYSGGTWTTKAQFANTASMNWTAQHIDIKAYAGKAFKIRFTAAGKHSDDILHWYVDNINVYGICKSPGFAPANVAQSQFVTTLTWTAPVCAVPMQLVKLFQWEGTPDNGYFQSYAYGYGVVYDLTTYPDAVLTKIDFHHASWGTVGIWNYMIHVVDWGTYTEVAALGPLSTTGDDKWEENILLGDIQGMGGHQVGIILEPMSNSATDAYPDFSADNIGPDGVSVYGPLADYSAMAPSGIGDFLQNLWISVPMEDAMATLIPRKITVGELQNANATRVATTSTPVDYLMTNQTATLLGPSDSSHVMGYNVYMTLDPTGAGPFTKMNASPVQSPYSITHPSTTEPGATFKYFVTALFEDSQNPGPVICEPSSDTVTVLWPAVGIIDPVSNSINLYPNPATNYVNVTATSTINSVEVMNFLGQTIYKNTDVKAMTLKLNVQGFQTGVYFVKVTALQGTKTTKITITH